MRQEKISIKWKIFLYLLTFAGILLLVLWLIQICYLDTFYKKIKTRYAEKIISETIAILRSGEEDAEEKIDELAAENNVAVFVTDMEGNALYDAEYIANSRIGSMSVDRFKEYCMLARDNGGYAKIEFFGEYSKEKRDLMLPRGAGQFRDEGTQDGTETSEKPQEDPEDMAGSIPSGEWKQAGRDDLVWQKMPEHTEEQEQPRGGELKSFRQNWGQEQIESVIYVCIVSIPGESYVLMVNTQLTPVDATVSTLRIELIWITGIMIVMALVIALLISRKVSKSLIRINEAAKEMARGNFSIRFDGKDYREVAELSDTLNLTAVELDKTESLRRELIANVSHDLRTPLTMIIAYSEGMRDLPGENTPENVQVVIDEAERLSGLVSDMLDISRLQAGVEKIHVVRYNLTESIESLLLCYNRLREREGYSILFSREDDVIVEADEYKIYQVMYNLINNAINYAGEDRCVRVRQIKRESFVRIEILDHGEGIAPEALPYVWDRYYRVDKTHKRALMGTGLGLSIVKSILELHGAAYGVESTLGEGSAFWFELKIAPELP